MSYLVSRAPSPDIGTSRVGERYFAVARSGSGFDVVLDTDLGSQDWDQVTTTANSGSTRNADAIDSALVRGGAESNTEPQLVNITAKVRTNGFGSGTFVFEIISQGNVTIT